MLKKALSASLSIVALSTVLTGCVTTAPKSSTNFIDSAPALPGPISLTPVVIANGSTTEMAGKINGLNLRRSNGEALPPSLEGWRPYWYWKGNRVWSPRVFAVSLGDGIGRNADGLYVKVQNRTSGRLVDALVVCPPVAEPDPSACAIPQQYEFEGDALNRTVSARNSKLDGLRSVSESVNSRFQIVSEETMATGLEQITKDRKLTAERMKVQEERRKREAAQAQAREEELTKRQEDWSSKAPKGSVLVCDSGTSLMPVGSSIDKVLLQCGFPGIGNRYINLTSMLSKGWKIETQSLLPTPDIFGGVSYSVSLILRKN